MRGQVCHDTGSERQVIRKHQRITGHTHSHAGIICQYQYSGIVNMELTKEQQDYLESKIKELQTNVRHITQLAMGWFAFFVTINYASMGWLAAKAPGGGSIDSRMIWIIAVVFIVQNILGIFAICGVEKATRVKSKQVHMYEKLIFDEGKPPRILKAESIPIKLYTTVERCLSVVLLSLALAWVAFALLLE